MELRQLEYFVAVVETGSFSQAAERCSVAQPSLSQQIIKLEKELGYPLFERLGRRIAITDAGNLLYPRAKSILSDVQHAKHSIMSDSSSDRGSLSVGIIPTLGPYLLYETVTQFKQQYPDVKLEIREDMTQGIMNQLLNAELDIGFVSLPIENKQIVTDKLFLEPLYVAVRSDHILAQSQSVDIATLSNTPFIRLSDQNCLSDQLDAFCYVQKIDPPTIYHTTQLATVMEYVRLGMGVSIVPACAVATYHGDGLVFKHISQNSLDRVIVSARHQGRTESEVSKTFTHILKQTWRALTA